MNWMSFIPWGINRITKGLLLAGGAGAVIFGGYVAAKKIRKPEPVEATTVIKVVPTIIEREPEPIESTIPMAEVLRVSDDEEQETAQG